MFLRSAPRFIATFLTALVLASPSQAQTGSTSLTMAQAIDALDENNLAFRTVEHQIAQAIAVRALAMTQLRPTVTLQGAYVLRDEQIELDFGNPFTPLAPYLEAINAEHGTQYELPDPALLLQGSGDPSIVQYRHDFSGSLIVDQTLYNARAMPYIRQARVGIRQAENGQEVLRFQLRGAVVQAYFAAVFQRRLIEVQERTVELSRLSLDAVTIAFEEDVGNRFEVNRAAVDLSRAERDLENARTAYMLAIHNLATVLNIAPDFEVVDPVEIDLPDAEVVRLELERSIDERPDVIAHDLEFERQEERIAESRARWFPSFFARAQANVQRASAFGGDQFSWFLQIGANWELYDGGARTAERRVRERELAAEESRREETLESIERAVSGLVLEIEQLRRDSESAREDIELARENVELTDAANMLGSATLLDTQVAREQLFLSELALVTAEVNMQARIYEMLRIVGDEPWEQ